MKNKQWCLDNGLEIVDIEEMTEEMLNDCHESLEICSLSYNAGTTLKEIDSVAFGQCVADYIDSLCTDGILTELYDGEFVNTEEMNELLEEIGDKG